MPHLKVSGRGPSGSLSACVAKACRRTPITAPTGSNSNSKLPNVTSIQAVRQPQVVLVM